MAHQRAFLMLSIVKIDIGDAKFQRELFCVGTRGRLDDSRPSDWRDTLTADRYSGDEMTVDFQLDCIIVAAEMRIRPVQVLALVVALPKPRAPTGIREEARSQRSGQPSCIVANTIKGKGVSFMEDQTEWHSGPPTMEQYVRALGELNAK